MVTNRDSVFFFADTAHLMQERFMAGMWKI